MQIKADEDFITWLDDQSPSIADGVLKTNTDAKWAARVTDLHKADKGTFVHQKSKPLLLLLICSY